MNNRMYHVDTARLNYILSDGKDRLPTEFGGSFHVNLPLYVGGRWAWDKLEFISGGTYRIIVRPSLCMMVETNLRYKRRTNMSHRILVECKCGRLIPSGRLHQHAAYCSKLTEK